MGRRSRQRSTEAPLASTPRTPGAPPPRRHATLDELPPAPWHPVPLVELAVLVGIISLVLGFLSDGTRRETLVVAGILLASLAGLEQSIREHVAGYRSHSSLLALVCAFAAGAIVNVLAGGSKPIVLAAAALAGVAAFAALRGVFARRAGGLTWRA